MEGVLWKWTNYWNGWQTRWFVLENCVLAYYKSQEEVNQGCKGSIKVTAAEIIVHPGGEGTRMDIVVPGEQHFYLRAPSFKERQQWLVALGSAKQSYAIGDGPPPVPLSLPYSNGGESTEGKRESGGSYLTRSGRRRISSSSTAPSEMNERRREKARERQRLYRMRNREKLLRSRRIENMPEDQVERCHAFHRIENMTEEQIEQCRGVKIQITGSGITDPRGVYAALRSRKGELRLYCDLIIQQVHEIQSASTFIKENQNAVAEGTAKPYLERMHEAASVLGPTCDSFFEALEECLETVSSTTTQHHHSLSHSGSAQSFH